MFISRPTQSKKENAPKAVLLLLRILDLSILIVRVLINILPSTIRIIRAWNFKKLHGWCNKSHSELGNQNSKIAFFQVVKM